MGKKNKTQIANRGYLLTYERKKELQDELQYLKINKRTEIAHKIKGIRLSDIDNYENNKAYIEAKNEQRNIEAHIQKIESIIKNSKMIDEDIILDTVVIGCKVKIYNLEYDEIMNCQIVDESEANSLQNKFSVKSPLGKALIGKKEGDIVLVNIGTNSIKYKILKIQEIDDKYRMNAVKKEVIDIENSFLRDELGKIEIRDITPKSFVTRVNVFRCVDEKHQLIDIRCRVKILNRNGKVEEHIVPGAYCETCDKYFLLENEFQKLRNKGILICKVVEKDYWMTSNKNQGYMSLNKESLLHILGYNVNAQTDLSKIQRWKLLEVIVDEGIMTITEIQSHLQWLIKRSNNNRNFEDAYIKWEMDYNHISNYKSGKKTVVDVKEINRINYRANK